MIVCHCNVFTDHDIRAACTGEGPDCPSAVGEVYRCFGCSPECGRCARLILSILRETAQGACAACPTAEAEVALIETGRAPALLAAE
jgi:bacterioferritin-associated ferredoxin